MDWKLKFISQENFVKHVEATIDKYGEKLESFDIKRFNKNIIDPIKLIFDKTVYQSTWEEMVGNEIFRQRDKSNNNDIGYFHQTIFQYMKNCHVPENGKEGGWDVIYENADGIQLPEGDVVHKIYVEIEDIYDYRAKLKQKFYFYQDMSKDDDVPMKLQNDFLHQMYEDFGTIEEDCFYDRLEDGKYDEGFKERQVKEEKSR